MVLAPPEAGLCSPSGDYTGSCTPSGDCTGSCTPSGLYGPTEHSLKILWYHRAQPQDFMVPQSTASRFYGTTEHSLKILWYHRAQPQDFMVPQSTASRFHGPTEHSRSTGCNPVQAWHCKARSSAHSGRPTACATAALAT